MALLHHDNRDYKTAAKQAHVWATRKLEGMIAEGRTNLVDTLNRVDKMVIKDQVCKAEAIRFRPVGDGAELLTDIAGEPLRLHPHALDQVVGKMKGTKKVTDWALEPDTAEEFASILNKKMARQEGKRFLARSVDGELRGLMSDRYRRLDVRPMVDALVQTAIREYKAVPIKSHFGETNFHMKLVLPTLYEPVENEVGVFALTFRNSDFGAGRLYLKGGFLRLWCTNLMLTEDGISQVHLGRALSDDIAFSEKTYELDTMTMASAIKDVTNHIFSMENIAMRMMAIKEAATNGVDIKQLLKGMVKNSKLSKAEGEQVAEDFNSPEIEVLPPGQTKWRLSNAIALVAQDASPDRQLELESLAGDVAGLVVKH